MSQAWGRRQLFIYWRLASEDQAAAVAALSALQRELCARIPGLRPRLMLRADSSATPTLMETYALDAGLAPAGLAAELIASIDTAADAATARWRIGERHREVFDALAE